jgi:hypothetical protein
MGNLISDKAIRLISELALQGNSKAIEIMDDLNIQPREIQNIGPIVYQKDGEIAAWIA